MKTTRTSLLAGLAGLMLVAMSGPATANRGNDAETIRLLVRE